MKKALQIRVKGRVQGVGFRYFTRTKAIEIGVNGFVKNLPDASVYIEAEGEEYALEMFSMWCRRGPSWAKVTHFETNPQPITGFDTFEIR
jgi:acylphosphatase